MAKPWGWRRLEEAAVQSTCNPLPAVGRAKPLRNLTFLPRWALIVDDRSVAIIRAGLSGRDTFVNSMSARGTRHHYMANHRGPF
jgi:hypothetical protein